MAARIGTAGWALGRDHAASFPQVGSALERYAAILPAAEINSSFHRPHRKATWRRWGESVPPDFRFSVKMPKSISHEQRLSKCERQLDVFFEQVVELDDRLGALLLQLPPSLAFEEGLFTKFVGLVRGRSHAPVACEPRHASFFTRHADLSFVALKVARVAADPSKSGTALAPGGWRGLSYFRLHGSPVIYRSSYADRLDQVAEEIRTEQRERETWCIFDNTASSAALGDALSLRAAL